MLELKGWKVWFPLTVMMAALVAMTATPSIAADDQGEANLELAGKSIVVTYGRPSTEGKGYKSMKDGVPEGFMWRLGKNNATTLESDADLKFGDVTVEAGKYSLVGKKTKDGWDLLVHPNANRWGSPVPEEGYIATIPLKVSKPDEEAKLMTIELKEKDGKGMFALIWGDQELSTMFEVAE